MTDGDIVEWLVGEGEHVVKGQDIVEVDTAKTTFNVSSPVSGKIVSLAYEEDDNVEVGEVIAKIEIDS